MLKKKKIQIKKPIYQAPKRPGYVTVNIMQTVESKMGTYWEPTRNSGKHLGNHRGIIWEIGETPPT